MSKTNYTEIKGLTYKGTPNSFTMFCVDNEDVSFIFDHHSHKIGKHGAQYTLLIDGRTFLISKEHHIMLQDYSHRIS